MFFLFFFTVSFVSYSLRISFICLLLQLGSAFRGLNCIVGMRAWVVMMTISFGFFFLFFSRDRDGKAGRMGKNNVLTYSGLRLL